MSKFATCLSCMDGRVHLPLLQYIADCCCVDYIDLITEPRIIKILAENNCNCPKLLAKINISILKHQSVILFVVAHFDCAGNPVPEEVQKRQVAVVVPEMARYFPHTAVTGLWVNEKFCVDEVMVCPPLNQS